MHTRWWSRSSQYLFVSHLSFPFFVLSVSWLECGFVKIRHLQETTTKSIEKASVDQCRFSSQDALKPFPLHSVDAFETYQGHFTFSRLAPPFSQLSSTPVVGGHAVATSWLACISWLSWIMGWNSRTCSRLVIQQCLCVLCLLSFLSFGRSVWLEWLLLLDLPNHGLN